MSGPEGKKRKRSKYDEYQKAETCALQITKIGKRCLISCEDCKIIEGRVLCIHPPHTHIVTSVAQCEPERLTVGKKQISTCPQCFRVNGRIICTNLPEEHESKRIVGMVKDTPVVSQPVYDIRGNPTGFVNILSPSRSAFSRVVMVLQPNNKLIAVPVDDNKRVVHTEKGGILFRKKNDV